MRLKLLCFTQYKLRVHVDEINYLDKQSRSVSSKSENPVSSSLSDEILLPVNTILDISPKSS
jgi:hypothetical protein